MVRPGVLAASSVIVGAVALSACAGGTSPDTGGNGGVRPDPPETRVAPTTLRTCHVSAPAVPARRSFDLRTLPTTQQSPRTFPQGIETSSPPSVSTRTCS